MCIETIKRRKYDATNRTTTYEKALILIEANSLLIIDRTLSVKVPYGKISNKKNYIGVWRRKQNN